MTVIEFQIRCSNRMIFTAWCYAYRGLCCRKMSVRPSHAGILSKRLNISSNFFHHRVVTPLWFFRTKQYGNILTGTPLTGASNVGGGMKKIAIFYQYLTLSRNGTRYGHGFYRMRIGNRIQAFEWYQFQWSWVTCNSDFKVTILFKLK